MRDCPGCSTCGAVNFGDAAFSVECGEPLGGIWKYSDGATKIPSLVWALLLWWLVTDAAHATKLAAEHPGLYAAIGCAEPHWGASFVRTPGIDGSV